MQRSTPRAPRTTAPCERSQLPARSADASRWRTDGLRPSALLILASHRPPFVARQNGVVQANKGLGFAAEHLRLRTGVIAVRAGARPVRAQRHVPQDVRPGALPAPGVGVARGGRGRAHRAGAPARAPGARRAPPHRASSHTHAQPDRQPRRQPQPLHACGCGDAGGEG